MESFFYYDKSFEGLLTAVFDAYKLKIFPQFLLAEEDVAPLFAELCHTVIWQQDKSDRVWHALERKLSKEALAQLNYVWFSEEPESDMLLFRYICKAVTAKESIELDFADQDVLGVFQCAQRVHKEQSYLVQFLRFQQMKENIYFAVVAPRCNVLPFTVKHFKNRFADQQWIVFDEQRKFGYFYDKESVSEIRLNNEQMITQHRLSAQWVTADEHLYQKLWQQYFKSITIEERRKPKQQRRSMPKRFWQYLTEIE